MADARTVPPEAQLVVDLLNTIDLETGEDELSTLRQYRRWLRAHGMLGWRMRPNEHDLALTRDVREGVRALLASTTAGRPADAGALELLNETLKRVQIEMLVLEDGEVCLRVDGEVGAKAAAVVLDALRTLQESGDAARLKVCRSHTCEWAYYDLSRNRSRSWCDMAVCGNKVKARTYRARRSGRDSA